MYEIDESFTYTTLFLLRINLLFNDKRSISLIEALEGRRVLEWNLNDEGICFKEIDEQEEFMKFLSECKDMVHYKNGFIILNDGITEHNIDEKFTFIKPAKYLDYSPKILKYLGINKPIDFINKYCDLERNIEELYMNNNKDNNKTLDSLYRKKEEILDSIKNGDEEYIDMITSIYSDIYNDTEDDYTIFPINRGRYLSSRHYDESRKINDLLYEPFECAIFTDYPLFRTKVKHDFNRIIDDSAEEELNDTRDNLEKFDPNEDYYDATVDSSENYEDNEDDINYNITNVAAAFPDGFGDCDNLSREQELFMLEYIRVLENMKDKYKSVSDELELLIKRLMYMVDNSNIGLYKGNDINAIIDDYKSNTDSDYMRIADEVMYFISEIFNTYYDRFCVRKILFVKTYYELSNDLEVINYINEFKGSNLYNHVYKIITGDYPSKVKRK